MTGVLEDFSMPRRVGDAFLTSLFYAVTLALAEFVTNEEPPILEFPNKNACRALMARMRKGH